MKFIYCSLIIVTIALIAGCGDTWDDHIKVEDSSTTKNIIETLEGMPETKTFLDAIKSTGLDKELESTQIYTVWAPDNSAMASVDSEILDSPDSLKQFISNHFSLGKTIYSDDNENCKLKMFGGKNLFINQNNKMIDDVVISNTYNKPAKNGVIHIINTAVELRPTIWQYIEKIAPKNNHVNYLNSLSAIVFDPEIAEQTGWTEDGRPIYDTISGLVWKNSFINNVADLRSEDSTFTFFIVEDDVFTNEYTKFSPYFKASSGSSAQDILRNETMLKYKITKDYVVNTTYTPDNLPTEVYSIYGVKVPVAASAIVDSFRASNGYVYILNSCDIAKEDKIPVITIEAETDLRWYAEGGSPAGYKRKNEFASGGYDFILDSHNNQLYTNGLIVYAGEMASIRYDFYWKAIDDFYTSYRYPARKDTAYYIIDTVYNSIDSTSFKLDSTIVTERLQTKTLYQQLGFTVLSGYSGGKPVFGTFNSVTNNTYIAVTDSTYENAPEIKVGTFKFSSMREIFLQLKNETKGMAVVADYFKLVPVFN